jgi:hypothetical protein
MKNEKGFKQKSSNPLLSYTGALHLALLTGGLDCTTKVQVVEVCVLVTVISSRNLAIYFCPDYFHTDFFAKTYKISIFANPAITNNLMGSFQMIVILPSLVCSENSILFPVSFLFFSFFSFI